MEGWEESGSMSHLVQKPWTVVETHFGLFMSEKEAVGTHLS